MASLAIPETVSAAGPDDRRSSRPAAQGQDVVAEPPCEDLARQAGRGSIEAFGVLVERHTRRLYNYLLQVTRHPQDAEDLTQDTFVKALQALRRGDPPRAFAAWLFTIARRTALNHFRDRRPVLPLDEEPADEQADPAGQSAGADDRRAVWLEARSLGPAQREVLWLRYADGLSVDEIAQATRRHPVHVRVLLHRARTHLARRLRSRESGPPLSLSRSHQRKEDLP